MEESFTTEANLPMMTPFRWPLLALILWTGLQSGCASHPPAPRPAALPPPSSASGPGAAESPPPEGSETDKIPGGTHHSGPGGGSATGSQASPPPRYVMSSPWKPGTVPDLKPNPEVEFPPGAESLPGYAQAVSKPRTVSPGPDSVGRGKDLYMPRCAPCHAENGQGVPSKGYARKVPMPDLRDARYYRYGSSDRAIFRSILYGIPGSPMDGYPDTMTDDEAWDITHYVQSLQTLP